MNISDSKWQKSQVSSYLKNFPGVVGQFCQQATASKVQKLEKNLPLIFWRWFYLYPDRSTPSAYQGLGLIKVIEDWQTNGQFYCLPLTA
jgi:hypothetical protein